MKNLKQRVYEPISNETIAKVFTDINTNKEEYIDLIPIPINDKLILIYYEQDKTAPTNEDIAMYSSGQPPQNSKGFDLDTIKELISKYRILVILGIAAIAVYYYYIRGG